jgi:hypothetical protein
MCSFTVLLRNLNLFDNFNSCYPMLLNDGLTRLGMHSLDLGRLRLSGYIENIALIDNEIEDFKGLVVELSVVV